VRNSSDDLFASAGVTGSARTTGSSQAASDFQLVRHREKEKRVRSRRTACGQIEDRHDRHDRPTDRHPEMEEMSIERFPLPTVQRSTTTDFSVKK
jgi:hypothetical protein